PPLVAVPSVRGRVEARVVRAVRVECAVGVDGNPRLVEERELGAAPPHVDAADRRQLHARARRRRRWFGWRGRTLATMAARLGSAHGWRPSIEVPSSRSWSVSRTPRGWPLAVASMRVLSLSIDYGR